MGSCRAAFYRWGTNKPCQCQPAVVPKVRFSLGGLWQPWEGKEPFLLPERKGVIPGAPRELLSLPPAARAGHYLDFPAGRMDTGSVCTSASDILLEPCGTRETPLETFPSLSEWSNLELCPGLLLPDVSHWFHLSAFLHLICTNIWAPCASWENHTKFLPECGGYFNRIVSIGMETIVVRIWAHSPEPGCCLSVVLEFWHNFCNISLPWMLQCSPAKSPSGMMNGVL